LNVVSHFPHETFERLLDSNNSILQKSKKTNNDKMGDNSTMSGSVKMTSENVKYESQANLPFRPHLPRQMPKLNEG
jgi:hypothetical protein